MTNRAVRVEHRDDGVRLLILDAPGRSANTMDPAYLDAMDRSLAELREAENLSGVVVTSAKGTFFAGGDLKMLRAVGPGDAQSMRDFVGRATRQLRILETLGVPVVAALNGTALGGGLEIALSCHHRVAVDDDRIQLGLPEVSLGLLPAANGLVRTVRLLGARVALGELLLTGRPMSPARALSLGLVNELVATQEDLLPAALRWIAANPGAAAPWDRPGHRIPGSELGHEPADVVADLPRPAQRALTGYPMPAPHAILAAACAGAEADFATAADLECRAFVELVTGPVAKNLIQSQFFDLQKVRSDTGRPDGHNRFIPNRVGVLGAGTMGQGIAEIFAASGAEVVLVDADIAAAEHGRDGIIGDRPLHAPITPGESVADLAGCDVVIEAAYEDPESQAQVFKAVESVVDADTLIASSTPTLPIGELAASLASPERFLGLHFFSPVTRMRLVEIVPGGGTGQAALARGIDIARALRKLSIVVSDSPGFFASRVLFARLGEAMAMVAEGVDPLRIEQVAVEAGYPVGPLALLDELTITLVHKARVQARTAAERAGAPWQAHPGDAIAAAMVRDHRRLGRAAGAGFYEYDASGRGRLWPGLARYRVKPSEPDDQTIAERLLFAESVDTLRCLTEGVLRSAADANIGSLHGIGFPSWTGGTAQYASGYPAGLHAFEARAAALARDHGARFTLPHGWRDHLGVTRD